MMMNPFQLNPLLPEQPKVNLEMQGETIPNEDDESLDEDDKEELESSELYVNDEELYSNDEDDDDDDVVTKTATKTYGAKPIKKTKTTTYSGHV